MKVSYQVQTLSRAGSVWRSQVVEDECRDDFSLADYGRQKTAQVASTAYEENVLIQVTVAAQDATNQTWVWHAKAGPVLWSTSEPPKLEAPAKKQPRSKK